VERIVLEEAAAALARGEVVAVPTDTVYGVAVDPVQPRAMEALVRAKGRPADLAVAVLVAGVAQAETVGILDDRARRLAARFWPGGLTLVVDRRPAVAWPLGGDPTSIGLRWPGHPVPTALAARVGPLATTSANRHGRPPLETAAEVEDELGGDVALVVDGGRCAGLASTVVDCRGGQVRILREGRIASDLVLTTV
jgi:tRNA threonylcarbamoyl adenosine modification protein (Sua5/YciO/YrdC/YwlC family)